MCCTEICYFPCDSVLPWQKTSMHEQNYKQDEPALNLLCGFPEVLLVTACCKQFVSFTRTYSTVGVLLK